MKQLKKTLLALLCVGMLFGMTACGTDNAADHNTVNDATENGGDQDGVLEDVGRGVDDGVRDVVDGVKDGVEDITDSANENKTGK